VSHIKRSSPQELRREIARAGRHPRVAIGVEWFERELAAYRLWLRLG
jgi:hypothetical protein